MLTSPSIRVSAPTFEHHHSGFGIHFPRPRISWKFTCEIENVFDWTQVAYDIEVCGSNDTQTYHVTGASSCLVPWPAGCTNLVSREKRHARVRCYGSFKGLQGNCCDAITEWSAWGSVEAALLEQNDWISRMITIADPLPLNDDGSIKPLRFRKFFSLPPGEIIVRARLYATSHGVYQPMLNGVVVGDQCMAPGWQSYHKRLHYQIYDVADLLRADSENIIEFDVGAGWFASALTSTNNRFFYGDTPGVLAQLEMDFQTEGRPNSKRAETISTDESWSCTSSPILSSEIYNGEIFDQRRDYELREEVHTRSTWQKTKISSTEVGRLISPNAPPVRVTTTLSPRSISNSASGRAIIDFGVNVVGRIRIREIQKPRGHRIIFRHAEVVQGNELYRRPLRDAEATDVLVCGGHRVVNWTPKFTFHGFRYVDVEGWSADEIGDDSIVAEVMHTDLQRVGDFTCSNEEVNILHQNAVRSLRGNFLSVPTDCPQRDDREGWTGDINIFMSSANFLYNTAGMLGNWLDDLYADQMEESEHWCKGVVPLVVPNCFLKKDEGDQAKGAQGWEPVRNGVWADAAIMVPWELFRSTGDTDILRRQYDSMVQYLENGVSRGLDGLWNDEQWQFGDWLDPTAPINSSGQTRTDGTFVADCFLLRSTELMGSIANVLQQYPKAKHYAKAYHDLLSAFQSKYISPTGLLVPDTPTAFALAIRFRLLPPASVTATANRLRRALRLLDFRIPTGFTGTAHLMHSLTETGQPSLAHTMLLSEAIPSFLYPVRMGATTIWERWDALKPDGTVHEGSMTSFNHYALGAVVSWLYECMGGIKVLTPCRDGEVQDGHEVHRFLDEDSNERLSILIQPQIHHAIQFVNTTYESRCGVVQCKWRFVNSPRTNDISEHDDEVDVDVLIPPNAMAFVVLPRISSWRSGSGQWRTTEEVAKAVEHPFRFAFYGREASSDMLKVGSGCHSFRFHYNRATDSESSFPVNPLLPPWGRARF